VIETEGAEFCPHHLRLAEEYGADLVRSGAVPKRRARPAVEELPAVMAMSDATPTGAIAAPNGPILAAVAAIPDLVARVTAIELFLDEPLARPSETN
jgi:hypothetical protein